MKKIINILLIAILSVVLIGLVLFGVSFAKDAFNHNENQEENSQNNSTQTQNNSTQTQNNTTNEQNATQNNNTSENNITQQTENQEEPPGKNNFNQDAVNKSLDEAAQNPNQFDEDGDGKIEDSERTTTTDLLESQGRLKIYSDDESEKEQ